MANIHQAAIQGDVQLLQQLLHSNPSTVDSQNMVTEATPLHLACEEGRLSAAKVLLEWKADINARDKYGNTPLHKTMDFVEGSFIRKFFSARTSATLAEFLLTHGASPDARNADGDTPLHKAAMHGHKQIIAVLLKHDADVNARNNKGHTPLQSARKYQQIHVAELLRKHGGREKMGL